MQFTRNTIVLFRDMELNLLTSDGAGACYPCLQFSHAAMSGGAATSAYSLTTSRLTPFELAELADQLHLASIQIRDYLASVDEGRRFERDQAIAFGADRLEGDLPNGPENTY